MIKKWNLFAVAIMLLCCYSCSDVVDINMEESSMSKVRIDRLFIEPEKSELSKEDAGIVAKLLVKGKQTKGEQLSIREIIVVNDDDLEPMYYIVNYSNDQGFVIVSATKNYVPILGYFENGNFDPAAKNHPLLSYLDDFKYDIAPINTIQVDSLRMNFSSEWVNFEQAKLSIPSIHRVSYDKDAAIKEWTAKGYNCLSLSSIRYYLPSNEADLFIRDITSQTAPGIDPMEASILLVKKTLVQYGPKLKTTWNQYAPFNYGAENDVAGCVPIALAQIMSYHKWPTRFNWVAIGINPLASNKEGQKLGVALRKDLNVTYYYNPNTTSATNKNAKSTFQDYGYTVNLQDYNIYNPTQTRNIGNEIISGRPVYMSGLNSSGGGHAWVCDGYKYEYTNYSALYVDRNFGSYSWYSGVSKGDEIKYFHMNWGWGGTSNGWLYSRSANTSETTSYKDISRSDYSNKREILFASPKR